MKNNRSVKEIQQDLLDVVLYLRIHEIAHDDDLKESWINLKKHWDELKEDVDHYIRIGDNHDE